MLPNGDVVERCCDSDQEEKEEEDNDNDATKGLIFTEVDTSSCEVSNTIIVPVENTNDKYDEDEYDDDEYDDDEYDDDEYCDELLEETLFALQDNYYFVRRIVCHGYVSLYKAIDRRTKENVCMKLVVRNGPSLDNIERLPIEARVLACIKSGPSDHIGKQYIQHPLAYFSSPSTYVIVSTLYQESSFRRTLFNKPDDIKICMKQLLHAIEYIHSIDIISRDIKNSNLLWDVDNKKAVLCDFDLSTFVTKQGHNAVLGTDGFIAPEVLLHEKTEKKVKSRYSKEIDIYSAGVVFGSLLYAISENDITVEIVSSWRSKLKKKRRSLSSEFMLLRKMLSIEPSTRPSATDCLKSDYFA